MWNIFVMTGAVLMLSVWYETLFSLYCLEFRSLNVSVWDKSCKIQPLYVSFLFWNYFRAFDLIYYYNISHVKQSSENHYALLLHLKFNFICLISASRKPYNLNHIKFITDKNDTISFSSAPLFSKYSRVIHIEFMIIHNNNLLGPR